MAFPEITLPRMVEVHQKISSPKLGNFVAEIRKELGKTNLASKIKDGARIAVTAGSRGIAHYPEILATVVDEVKKAGGDPFLVPAMGSHGGATSEGQIGLLKNLGIMPETVGAPIRATMKVELVGRLDNGSPVYVDRNALSADGIIVVGRVKPHTDFKGEIESGLMKMMVIGLGKKRGAEIIHRHKSEGYHNLLPQAARLIMKKVPIILGLAVVENAYHEIAIVKAVEPENIEQEERNLLKKAKALTARIPFKDIDVLIVNEIGKEISGMGMDTNVVGRFWLPGEIDPLAPNIKIIVVLDLTEQTHGNALGIGLADLTTQRLVSKIDYPATFVNSITGGHAITGKTPVFLSSDRDAIATALHLCGPIDPQEAKVVRIKNTQELERLWVSESLYKMAKANPKLEIGGEPEEMSFDVSGNLAR
ncbi:MAG: nickel-dependent lactate racemase [Candidatus Bathyarchaeota archaeon]|nr:nickel-dependent lactate racemase [Candidatus Bathyarchaeota archaeon]